MDHRQLDLDELRAMTAGAESGGFSLSDILADYEANSESGIRNAELPKTGISGDPRATARVAPAADDPSDSRNSEFSIDDILAEFYAGDETPSPAPRRRETPSKETRTNSVKHRTKKNSIASESAAGRRAPEPVAESTAAVPESRPQSAAPEPKASAAPSWSFTRKSPLPNEAEIRAFVADYTAAAPEAAASERAPAESFDADRRYRIGEDRGARRELRYDGRSVDVGVEAGYVPREAPEYVSSYAPDEPREDGGDEEVPDEAPRFGFLSKLRERFERERGAYLEKEERRRRAAEKKPEYRQAREMELPGESGIPDTGAASDPDATQVFAREEAGSAPDPDATQVFTRPKERPVESEAANSPHSEFQTPDSEFDFSPAWTRKLANQQPYASAFPDTSANPAVYAAQSDYEYEDEDDADRADESRALLEDEDFFPPTFKEYILSRLTVLLYRLRGGRRVSLTAEEDDEELGPEVPVAKASKYYGSFLRSMRLRLRVSGAVLLVMAWISLGLPVTGRFNDTAVAALFCLAAQLTVMLLCLDVVVKAFTNALRGRFGADFMAVLVCVVTSLDALLSSLAGFGQVHLPLCLLSSLSLTGILLSSYMSCQGLRKALRVPAIARRSYTVTGETDTKTGEVTLLKSVRPVKGFVRRSEEAAPDETLFTKISLPLLALVLLLTVVTVVAKRNAKDIFYILSVLLVPAVPFTALLAFAIPFAQGSRRLFPSGAAVAGWSGVVDIGQSKNLIVTDRDLFPEGTVELDTVRIFADAPPERIISYAGSLLCAGGSGVSGCFAALMERKNCPMRKIENFEVLPGGGLKGIIDSSIVLCGSTDLMQLMNVRIPYRLVSRQSVLLAVDGVLYGIFNMKYTPDNRVRAALLGLMRSGRHPVFAIRDFNVTPAMLHDTFEVATDGYDFPPYAERFPMSEGAPGPDSKVSAVVCREGLGPLSDTADFGRRMYVYTRVNLYAALLSAVLGVLVSFIRLLAAGGVSVGFLLVFMALWSVPALLTGAVLRVE